MTESPPSHSPLDYRVTDGKYSSILQTPLDFSVQCKERGNVSLLSSQQNGSTSSAFKVVTPKGKTDGELKFVFF